MTEMTNEKVKEMYEKLCKQLSEYAGGVDQYVDFKSLAVKSGFKVTKLFRGNDRVLDRVSGRYEVWIEIPGWGDIKAGKGNSLGQAVTNAICYCFYMNNNIYKNGTNMALTKCTCPKECDCQNPPPDDWDGKEGIYHISELCPVHNENPRHDQDCPVHG